MADKMQWPMRTRIVAATAGVLTLVAACAPGGTSGEDRRRLAALKAEPLLERIEQKATLQHASNFAGTVDGVADRNSSQVNRTYFLTDDHPRPVAIDISTLAGELGWDGVLMCSGQEGAWFLGHKTFGIWVATLSAHFVRWGDGVRLELSLETPHVSRRDEVVQVTSEGSPKDLRIEEKCR